MLNLLNELEIHCRFEECRAVVGYAEYDKHIEQCEYNPENTTECIFCCEAIPCYVTDHNDHCIDFIKFKMSEMQLEIDSLRKQLDTSSRIVHVHKKSSESFGCTMVFKGLSATIDKVERNSPSWRAGVRVGDVVTAINGKDITTRVWL